MKNRKIDMTGWIMSEHGVPDSRLIVIEQAEDYVNPTTGKHVVQWLCKCNCNEHRYVISTGASIRNGSVKSCGCLSKEATKKMGKENKKSNRYKFLDNIAIGYDSKNSSFIIDLEDYELIKDYCWNIDANGYAIARNKDGKIIKMHRLITNALKNDVIDHIDRNRSNNVKSNLRITDAMGNAINHTIRHNNLSNVSGVTWYDKNKKWRAFVIVDGKNKYVYYGDNKEEAIIARLNAEVKYYGDFAPQKHLFEQYGIIIQNELEETNEL